MFSRKPTASKPTEFSEFIRKASSAKKKRVYTEVLRKATARQADIGPGPRAVGVRCR